MVLNRRMLSLESLLKTPFSMIFLLISLAVANATNNSTPTPPPSPVGVVQQSDLIIIHGFLVFFMQIGFVSLELGYGRSKNVRNILLKNVVDVLLCALFWWLVGYGLENGGSPEEGGRFMGTSDFVPENPAGKSWFFTFSFALATVSIVSGCLAERTNLMAYPIVTIVLTAWVYPIIGFWAWAQQSWLQTMSACRFLDFAGGTAVHTVGGCMGLVGAILCGPRLGRFEDGQPKAIPGHDVSSVAIGTFFIWFGWFGFNCGSLYIQPNIASVSNTGQMVDRVALNMTLSASTSGLVALFITSLRTGTFDLVICCNGVLAGLVAATSTCGYIAPWSSLIVGFVAGSAYLGCSKLMLYLQIDDPQDSASVHFCSGVVGTILNGMFAKPLYISALEGAECGGFIYTSQGGTQLGMQILGAVVAVAWTTFFSLLVFVPLRHFGRLRVDQATELAGIDNMEHGGPAYPEFNLVLSPQHTDQ